MHYVLFDGGKKYFDYKTQSLRSKNASYQYQKTYEKELNQALQSYMKAMRSYLKYQASLSNKVVLTKQYVPLTNKKRRGSRGNTYENTLIQSILEDMHYRVSTNKITYEEDLLSLQERLYLEDVLLEGVEVLSSFEGPYGVLAEELNMYKTYISNAFFMKMKENQIRIFEAEEDIIHLQTDLLSLRAEIGYLLGDAMVFLEKN